MICNVKMCGAHRTLGVVTLFMCMCNTLVLHKNEILDLKVMLRLTKKNTELMLLPNNFL